MTKIEELIAAQLACKEQIEYRLSSFIKLAKAKRTLTAIQNRLEDVHLTWEECRKRHLDILTLADDTFKGTHKYFLEKTFEKITDSMDEARDTLREHLAAIAPPKVTNPNPPGVKDCGPSPIPMQTTLPAIALPKFNGDISAWPSFRDVFKSLVASRVDLTNLQRLHYLKASLQGEAARLLSNTPIMESRYTEAWTLLTERYERKRAILYSHLQRLMNLTRVTSGSIRELKSLLDVSREVRTAFLCESRLVELGEDMFVFWIVSALDRATRRDWELSLGDPNVMPTYATLEEFLNKRIGAWETSDPSIVTEPVTRGNKLKSESTRTHQVCTAGANNPTSLSKPTRPFIRRVCACCDGSHFTYQCDTFLSLSVPQRLALIQRQQRCLNCFALGHLPSQCNSRYRCNKCQQSHHTLLHFSKRPPHNGENKSPPHDTAATVESSPQEVIPTSSNGFSQTGLCCTVLPTASVVLTGTSGRAIEVRALLDQGSQSSFMSESLLQVLRPLVKPVSVNVTVLGAASAGAARYAATVSVRPRVGVPSDTTMSVLVLPKLTAYIPPPVPVTADLSHLTSLPLADRAPFSNHPISLIIGADYYCQLLRDGLIIGPNNSPSAQNTVFGWVLSGRLCDQKEETVSCHLTTSDSDNLHGLMQAFWEVEEVPPITPVSSEDKFCEEHFLQTHTRLSNGRYAVRLPFREPLPLPIGDTLRVAMRVLLSSEARLTKQPDLKRMYHDFLREYEVLGHMSKVPVHERRQPSSVYLPHHVVLKESSSTTKARVVFNASALSSNGKSLNDFLYVGPKLQSDLFALILRWRAYKYVYATDIEKMFRQIVVLPPDIECQRILWRPHQQEEVEEYRLNTVTYGTAPAPFLANRVLKQLVVDNGNDFPLAVPILSNQIYVDDLMFGGDDIGELIQSRNQLLALLKAGGFRAYKWIANTNTLLDDLPNADRSINTEKPLGEEMPHKVLGIYWDPLKDVFSFQVKPETGPLTKRTFLSLVARIYDPLGWLTPYTISGKVLIQKLWLHQIGWDDALSSELSSTLSSFSTQLNALNQVVIPRWTCQTGTCYRLELHGYADASNSAYSAVVYLRVETSSGSVKTSLLYAKSKVAPLKLLSVPRLELCGAELLVRSITFVQRAMLLESIPVHCWTDSTTVLSWLQSPPSRWKVFVAHRVSKIQHALPQASWRYVPTGENPADCASRGISATALLDHPLWWQGPVWLQEPPSSWPRKSLKIDSAAEVEMRVADTKTHVGVTTDTSGAWDLLHRYSSFPRFLRVFSYILRFIHRCKSSNTYVDLYLSPDEIESARLIVCRLEQQRVFGAIPRIDGKARLPDAFRKLKSLSPFIDEHGLIRVGGRLSHSLLPFDAKHPILIPTGHIADLLARQAHLCTLHGGLRVSLYMLRQRYWVVHARSVVKRCIHNCVTCTRARAQCAVQRLADLPQPRVIPSRPFSHTGVDFAGPFNIRTSKGRGIKTHKAYLSIFVCLSTRAVHLEVVDDYTTDGFLAAFDRFTARRGSPSDMYSDNGTNFVGADKELSRRLNAVLRDPDLRARFAGDGLRWHFIPPSAPHFGGLWEAGVKSCKYHLKRVIGNFTPTFEEFTTLLCKIECILNSRPIGPLSDDVDSLEALTPGHLLTGAHLRIPPQPSLLDISENRLGRWQFVARTAEAFWKQWSADYLNAVQQRGKWRERQPNIKPGDLVLLKSNHLPPSKWELGRIAEVFPGADGLVRVVSVRTSTSVFKRPITQLCKLPVEVNS